MSNIGPLDPITRLLTNPALRDRDFLKLCGGSSLNNVGMAGEQVVIGILVYEITQSTAWVGISIALYNLPMLIFGLASGVVADWMDRRTLLRRVELSIVFSSLIFAWAIASTPGALWPVILYSVVSGTIRDSAYAARMSYAYDLVGSSNVVAGLSILNLSSRAGQLLGALLAGWATQQYGAPVAIASLAAAHGIACVLLLRLRSGGGVRAEDRVPMAENLRQCWAEMKTNRTLLVLMVITAMVEVFGFSFSTTLPALATDKFNVGAEGLGEMHATRAVGGILAALALAAFVGAKGRGALYIAVICTFGGSLVMLGAADRFLFALGALIFVAGLASASDVLTQSMMQLSVPDALRGRAMGFWVFAIGWAPVGHLEIGWLSESAGVENALFIHGAALIAVGVLAFAIAPRLKRL